MATLFIRHDLLLLLGATSIRNTKLEVSSNLSQFSQHWKNPEKALQQ